MYIDKSTNAHILMLGAPILQLVRSMQKNTEIIIIHENKPCNLSKFLNQDAWVWKPHFHHE